uniref:Uncharacterized protein n=1 Tax=Arundo donax TaxID=35708 RepID=A0A0A9GFT8_ARUDO
MPLVIVEFNSPITVFLVHLGSSGSADAGIVVSDAEPQFRMRWFTPVCEVTVSATSRS